MERNARFMFRTFIQAVLGVAGVYLGAGLVFALVFHARGLRRVDAAGQGAGIFFRLLITPGLTVLWPLVALKWRHALGGGSFAGDVERIPARRLRAGHGLLIKLLVILVPAFIALAMWFRPVAPVSPGPLPLGATPVLKSLTPDLPK